MNNDFLKADQTAVVDALHRLIIANEQSVELFQAIAAVLSNDLLRAMFASYAQQRTQFIIALKAEIYRHRRNGLAQRSQTSDGKHQKPEATLRSHGERAMLRESIQNENHVLQAYSEVLRSPLPADVLWLVHRQYKEIDLVFENIRRAEKRLDHIH
jgi:uncharacterized protein (TIGR02284 family)